jgi:hypothetical protein
MGAAANPSPCLVVVRCRPSVDPSFEVPLSFEGRAPEGGCARPCLCLAVFAPEPEIGVHSIERGLSAPERGDASQEELETELDYDGVTR